MIGIATTNLQHRVMRWHDDVCRRSLSRGNILPRSAGGELQSSVKEVSQLLLLRVVDDGKVMKAVSRLEIPGGFVPSLDAINRKISAGDVETACVATAIIDVVHTR